MHRYIPTMNGKRPMKRKLMGPIPRAVWDPKHPGPIAQRIRATHSDDQMIRYQFHTVTDKKMKAWVRLPTPAMSRARCKRCPGTKHKDTNESCKITAKKKYNLATGRRGVVLHRLGDTLHDMPGRWIVSLHVPPKMRSGSAELIRIPHT